jgi:hypothetical protein
LDLETEILVSEFWAINLGGKITSFFSGADFFGDGAITFLDLILE